MTILHGAAALDDTPSSEDILAEEVQLIRKFLAEANLRLMDLGEPPVINQTQLREEALSRSNQTLAEMYNYPQTSPPEKSGAELERS